MWLNRVGKWNVEGIQGMEKHILNEAGIKLLPHLDREGSHNGAVQLLVLLLRARATGTLGISKHVRTRVCLCVCVCACVCVCVCVCVCRDHLCLLTPTPHASSAFKKRATAVPVPCRGVCNPLQPLPHT